MQLQDWRNQTYQNQICRCLLIFLQYENHQSCFAVSVSFYIFYSSMQMEWILGTENEREKKKHITEDNELHLRFSNTNIIATESQDVTNSHLFCDKIFLCVFCNKQQIMMNPLDAPRCIVMKFSQWALLLWTTQATINIK